MAIIFSRTFLADLDAILGRIRLANRTAARRIGKRIRSVCRRVLGKHPLVGEACDHLRSGLRRFTVENYVIYFRPAPCEAIRIFDGSQDHESLVRRG